MTTVNIQFTDATKTKVATFFATAQPTDLYPNQGMVDSSDPLWITFYEAAGGSLSGLPAPTAT